MPLYKQTHKNIVLSRIFNCLKEYMHTEEEHLLYSNYICGKVFPEDKQINLYE